MAAEFVIQGHSLTISCSLGISIFPEHGADGETLIKNADAAMYRAKESGRNNFRFFTEDMNAQVMERLTLEKRLKLALEKEQLFLMYQPQVDMAPGKSPGLEALLRWQHPEVGLVPPDKFIRIAENCGTDRAHRRMGAPHRLLAGQEMAGRRTARCFGRGQCISGPVSSARDSANSSKACSRRQDSPRNISNWN